MAQRKKNNKIKPGMKVKVVGSSAGHGQPIGSVVTVVTANLNTYGDCTCKTMLGQTYTFYSSDIQLLPYTKAEIQKNIIELELEIAKEKAKLKFLAETKQEEYDDEEFQAYQVLSTLSSKRTSKIDKAKEIVKILRG